MLATLIIVACGLLNVTTPYVADPEVTLLPWLVSKGWVMYTDVIDQHPPLLTWLIAWLGAGDPGWPLRIFIACVHIAMLWLTYLAASRLGGPLAGLGGLLLAEVWSVAFGDGRLWYDAVLAPVYAGVLLLVVRLGGTTIADGRSTIDNARRPGDLLISAAVGLLLGLGIATKQHAVVTIPFVLLAIWLSGKEGRTARLMAFAAGVTLPLVIVGLVLAVQGALSEAWYWIVVYSIKGDYVNQAALPPRAEDWLPLLAFFLPVPAIAILFLRYKPPVSIAARVAWLGMLLAAVLPIYPRFATFHLEGAVPMLAIAGGLVLVQGWHKIQRVPTARLLARWRPALAVTLTSASILAGAWLLFQTMQLYMFIGPPLAPYASTLSSLRSWVTTHARSSPVFIYGLDSSLYRALEVEPPRPWAPQLPWVLQAHSTEQKLWTGVEEAKPKAVLVAASAWDPFPAAGPEPGPPLLHRDYHESARFEIAPYTLSPPVEVVALLSNDAANR